MDHNVYRGRLERWNDDKGFGFVRPENATKEIFIHISSLKNMSRRPVVGDVISFRVETDDSGKSRAVNASIAGVPSIKPKRENAHGKKRAGCSFSFSSLVFLVIIGVTSYAGYDKWRSREIVEIDTTRAIAEPIREAQDNAQIYQCDGRTYCSEMTSCKEATFFIRNCPNAKMDGDHDGVPCEGHLCKHW